MKLAILFAGHFRSHDGIYKIFKENVYDKYECDVFMHTWDKHWGYREPIVESDMKRLDKHLSFSTKELKEKFNIKEVVIDKYDEEFKDYFFKETLKYYHRKSVHQDTQEPFLDMERSNTHEYMTRAWSFIYKRWQCFEMMKIYSLVNNVNYDLIISCRPDYAVYGDFENLPKDKLTLPHLYVDPQVKPQICPIMDAWAIGPMNLMQEWSSLYARLRLMDKQFKYGYKLFAWNADSNHITDSYIRYLNIPFNMVSFNNPPFVTEIKNL